MKLGRSWVESLDGLACRIFRVSPKLGRTDRLPVGEGEQRLARNVDAAVHFHWFFSGADLLCMQTQVERASDARGVAVQASDAS